MTFVKPCRMLSFCVVFDAEFESHGANIFFAFLNELRVFSSSWSRCFFSSSTEKDCFFRRGRAKKHKWKWALWHNWVFLTSFDRSEFVKRNSPWVFELKSVRARPVSSERFYQNLKQHLDRQDKTIFEALNKICQSPAPLFDIQWSLSSHGP